MVVGMAKFSRNEMFFSKTSNKTFIFTSTGLENFIASEIIIMQEKWEEWRWPVMTL